MDAYPDDVSSPETQLSTRTPAPESQAWRWLHRAVLGLFLVLAYCYVFTIQPKYGPDEERHYRYVQRLVEKQALPVRREAHEEDGAHTLHPPLYYLLVTPVYMASRPFGEDAAYRAIKCVSPLLLLGALLLFLRTLRRLFPERPFAGAAALAVVALLPEFQLEAAVMNNDGLAVLLGSVWLWWLVRAWDDPPSVRDAVVAGLIMAAFANTKATGLTLAPLWAVALHFRASRTPERRLLFLRDLALAYGVLLLLGTWWYVRNYLLYGQPVPLDFGPGGALRPVDLRTGQPLAPAEVYTSGWIVYYGWRATEGLFQSFWSQIDWIREEYRPAVWGALLVLTLVAAVGGVLALARVVWQWRAAKAAGERFRWVWSPLWLPGLAFLLNWLHTWYIASFMHQGFYQGGRYLMPSVFGAGALLAAGWDRLVPRRLWLPGAALLALLLVGLNVLCLVELITVLNPKYVR